ncbi:MAG: hypothetical protein IPQ27_08885 [Chitinophagaceae bacterium]|nr:hypothetical protein [Chitinophagaceae bacterium]
MAEPLKLKLTLTTQKQKACYSLSLKQEGKYTTQKPDLTQVTYKRLDIQEQDKIHSVDEIADEVILFGVSY